jgi:hypothetical protein
MRHTLGLAVAVALTACAGSDDRSADCLESVGLARFRYTTASSVIHPLYGEQAEHSRLAHLEKHLKEARLCPDGYRITARTPPMAYGRFNNVVTARVVTPITYTGECIGRAAPGSELKPRSASRTRH